MSFYQKITKIGQRFIPKHTLFKYGFNWSPMYRRSVGKLTHVSEDLLQVDIKLPLNYKNRNFVGSTFGGSLFSALDPIPMIQLLHILGDNYVVWDKSAQVRFKRPGRETLYASFIYTKKEIEDIKQQVALHNEIDITKINAFTTKNSDATICEVSKTMYVAKKSFYKEKMAKRRSES